MCRKGGACVRKSVASQVKELFLLSSELYSNLIELNVMNKAYASNLKLNDHSSEERSRCISWPAA